MVSWRANPGFSVTGNYKHICSEYRHPPAQATAVLQMTKAFNRYPLKNTCQDKDIQNDEYTKIVIGVIISRPVAAN